MKKIAYQEIMKNKNLNLFFGENDKNIQKNQKFVKNLR